MPLRRLLDCRELPDHMVDTIDPLAPHTYGVPLGAGEGSDCGDTSMPVTPSGHVGGRDAAVKISAGPEGGRPMNVFDKGGGVTGDGIVAADLNLPSGSLTARGPQDHYRERNR